MMVKVMKVSGPMMFVLALAMAVTSAPIGHAAEAKRLLEGKDLFALQWVSDPQIRPDGKMVAYVRHGYDEMSDREVQSIWLVDVATGEQKQVGAAGLYFSPRWSPQGDRLGYLFSGPDGKNTQIGVYSVRSGQTSAITAGEQTPREIAWSPDGHSIAFLMLIAEPPLTLGAALQKPAGASWAEPLRVIDAVNFHADGKGYLKRGYSHVFLVPAEGGAARQVSFGAYTEVGPLAWTPDGAHLLLTSNRDKDWEREPMDASGSHPRHQTIYRLSLADGSLTPLSTRVGSFRMPTLSPDGKTLAYLGFEDKGLGHQDSQLTIAGTRGGDRQPIGPSLDRPIEAYCWASDSRSVYISYVDAGATKVARMSPDGRLKVLVSSLANGDSSLDLPYSGGEFSASLGGTLAYTGGDASRPSELFVDAAGQARQLTHLNDEALAAVDLSVVRPLKVTSSFDGRSIGAWELAPPHASAKGTHPLILEIHGGPYGSYGPVFSMEDQVFAAAGYIVVYANPRGSTSYGEEFANLIQHHYPEHDFDDLMSVVDAAIQSSGADPENLFVTGQSGGGILTAWTVGRTHRFRAAASQSPVIDWASWVLTSDVYAHVVSNWFEHPPWKDEATYWRQSPLSLVNNVTTPTLVIDGDRDLRTTLGQAEEFYQALQLHNVPTALMVIPGASHAVFSPSQMAAQMSAILAWFERYKHAD